MAVFKVTKKEFALRTCARMILGDLCPPAREHYLCDKQEDDSDVVCFLCWDEYLDAVTAGSADPNEELRRSKIKGVKA